MPKLRKWTDEEKALLIRLRAEGKDYNECAAMLNRTVKAITSRLYAKHSPCYSTGSGRNLTEAQLAWLDKHFKHTRNEDIQKRLKISFSALHRLARERGLKKTKQFMKKSQENAQKAAKESHIANGTYPPKGYLIPGREKSYFRPGKGRGVWERVSKRKAAEMKAKAHASLEETRRRDRLRDKYGLRRLTKFRFVRQSQSKVNYRLNLRKQGYVEDPSDHNLYHIYPSTIRGAVRESHAPQHGIKFVNHTTKSQTN